MRIDVLTLFPEMFTSPLSASILGRAQERGIVEVCLTNIRDHATDGYRKVDDKPYGGGPGMVMMPGPVFDCFEDVCAQSLQKPRVLVLSPQGRPLTQVCVRELSREDRLVLLAGRYEGFDERIRLGLGAEQLSIGDYVLSGGELAAMVLIDAVVRLLPGALGHADSPREESFEDGLLEFPQYTRPEVFRDMSVPEVLLSGDHARIATWRREQARERTLRWRPDLLREEQ